MGKLAYRFITASSEVCSDTPVSGATALTVPPRGSAFSKRNLDYFCKFYLCFSDLEIVNARVHNRAGFASDAAVTMS